MESYIGKTCPYCKAEIKEGEEIKVCPVCGIPHHVGCWEENKGCTTFGCSEQHYEEQGTNPTEACDKCGTPLGDGQVFCPKCGAPKVSRQTNCDKCGAPLAEGQEFCGKCGQKVGVILDSNTSNAINQFNAGVNKINDAKKKKPVKMIIAAVVAAVVVIMAPKLFVSVEDLCAQGNYIKAYAKASGSEKEEVLAENVIAYLSEESSDHLKDPNSFNLREGYYYTWKNEDGTFGQQAVLYLSGNNSYGAAVSNYWVWVYDNDDEEWGYWGSFDTAEIEDDDELSDMLGKVVLESVLEKGLKLEKSQVKNINAQFEADTLYTVELIDKDDIDTSRFTVSESDD